MPLNSRLGGDDPERRVKMLLQFSLSNFEEGGENDDEPPDGECAIGLAALGERRYRVLEPTSLTPFGPLGPCLTLGQVIVAEDVGAGILRYLRTESAPRIWSRSIPDVSREAIERDATRRIPGRLRR